MADKKPTKGAATSPPPSALEAEEPTDDKGGAASGPTGATRKRVTLLPAAADPTPLNPSLPSFEELSRRRREERQRRLDAARMTHGTRQLLGMLDQFEQDANLSHLPVEQSPVQPPAADHEVKGSDVAPQAQAQPLQQPEKPPDLKDASAERRILSLLETLFRNLDLFFQRVDRLGAASEVHAHEIQEVRARLEQLTPLIRASQRLSFLTAASLQGTQTIDGLALDPSFLDAARRLTIDSSPNQIAKMHVLLEEITSTMSDPPPSSSHYSIAPHPPGATRSSLKTTLLHSISGARRQAESMASPSPEDFELEEDQLDEAGHQEGFSVTAVDEFAVAVRADPGKAWAILAAASSRASTTRPRHDVDKRVLREYGMFSSVNLLRPVAYARFLLHMLRVAIELELNVTRLFTILLPRLGTDWVQALQLIPIPRTANGERLRKFFADEFAIYVGCTSTDLPDSIHQVLLKTKVSDLKSFSSFSEALVLYKFYSEPVSWSETAATRLVYRAVMVNTRIVVQPPGISGARSLDEYLSIARESMAHATFAEPAPTVERHRPSREPKNAGRRNRRDTQDRYSGPPSADSRRQGKPSPAASRPSQAPRSGRTPKPDDVCRKCGESGHWAFACPRRHDDLHDRVNQLRRLNNAGRDSTTKAHDRTPKRLHLLAMGRPDFSPPGVHSPLTPPTVDTPPSPASSSQAPSTPTSPIASGSPSSKLPTPGYETAEEHRKETNEHAIAAYRTTKATDAGVHTRAGYRASPEETQERSKATRGALPTFEFGDETPEILDLDRQLEAKRREYAQLAKRQELAKLDRDIAALRGDPPPQERQRAMEQQLRELRWKDQALDKEKNRAVEESTKEFQSLFQEAIASQAPLQFGGWIERMDKRCTDTRGVIQRQKEVNARQQALRSSLQQLGRRRSRSRSRSRSRERMHSQRPHQRRARQDEQAPAKSRTQSASGGARGSRRRGRGGLRRLSSRSRSPERRLNTLTKGSSASEDLKAPPIEPLIQIDQSKNAPLQGGVYRLARDQPLYPAFEAAEVFPPTHPTHRHLIHIEANGRPMVLNSDTGAPEVVLAAREAMAGEEIHTGPPPPLTNADGGFAQVSGDFVWLHLTCGPWEFGTFRAWLVDWLREGQVLAGRELAGADNFLEITDGRLERCFRTKLFGTRVLQEYSQGQDLSFDISTSSSPPMPKALLYLLEGQHRHLVNTARQYTTDLNATRNTRRLRENEILNPFGDQFPTEQMLVTSVLPENVAMLFGDLPTVFTHTLVQKRGCMLTAPVPLAMDPNVQSIHRKNYAMKGQRLEFVNEKTAEIHQMALIEQRTSAGRFQTPLMTTGKKDGGTRLLQDLRPINKAEIKPASEAPNMTNMTRLLENPRYKQHNTPQDLIWDAFRNEPKDARKILETPPPPVPINLDAKEVEEVLEERAELELNRRRAALTWLMRTHHTAFREMGLELFFGDAGHLVRIEFIQPTIPDDGWLACYDIANAFWQVALHPDSREYTGFKTPSGASFQWCVLPMGLSSSPVHFVNALCRPLDSIRQPVIHRPFLSSHAAMVYADDITLGNEHLLGLFWATFELFMVLTLYSITIKAPKSVVAARAVDALGSELSPEGRSPSQRHLQEIHNFPAPINREETRRFLGLANFFAETVPYFSIIAAPLNALLSQRRAFHWEETEQLAFEQVRELLLDGTVNGPFHPDEQLHLACDASDVAIAAVLFQTNEAENRRLISSWGRTLSPSEKRWPPQERELLAIVAGLLRYHTLTRTHHTIVESDSANAVLWAGAMARLRNGGARRRLEGWVATLCNFPATYVYRPGKENTAADAVSRLPNLPCPKAELPAEDIRQLSVDLSVTDPFTAEENDRQELEPPHGPQPMLSVAKKVSEEGVGQALDFLQILESEFAPRDKEAIQEKTRSITELNRSLHQPNNLDELDIELKRIENELGLDFETVEGIPEDFFTRFEGLMQQPNEMRINLLTIQDTQPIPLEPTSDQIQTATKQHLAELNITLEPHKWRSVQEISRNERHEFTLSPQGVIVARLRGKKLGKTHHGGPRFSKPAELGTFVPPAMRYALLRAIHGRAHQGSGKILSRLRADELWWPQADREARQVARNCPVCIIRKRKFLKSTDVVTAAATTCNSHLIIDIVGPLQPAADGSRFVLSAMDLHSRFVQFYAMKGATAEETIAALEHGWFQSYGRPRLVHCDNGPNFRSKKFQEFCKTHGSKIIYGTPYHPTSQAPLERVHGVLKDTIFSLIHGLEAAGHPAQPREWSDVLPRTCNALNASPLNGSTLSPNLLFLGREERIFWTTAEASLNSIETFMWMKQITEHASELLAELRLNKQAKRRKLGPKRGEPHPSMWKSGDLVVWSLPAAFRAELAKTLPGGLVPRFDGPWRLLNPLGPFTWRIAQLGDTFIQRTAAIDQLYFVCKSHDPPPSLPQLTQPINKMIRFDPEESKLDRRARLGKPMQTFDKNLENLHWHQKFHAPPPGIKRPHNGPSASAKTNMANSSDHQHLAVQQKKPKDRHKQDAPTTTARPTKPTPEQGRILTRTQRMARREPFVQLKDHRGKVSEGFGDDDRRGRDAVKEPDPKVLDLKAAGAQTKPSDQGNDAGEKNRDAIQTQDRKKPKRKTRSATRARAKKTSPKEYLDDDDYDPQAHNDL